MTSARFQSTTADSKPKPRSTNHSSRSLPMSKSSCVMITAMPKAAHSKSPSPFSDPTRFFCSTCHKCVFNANHDACITKLLKEVNSRVKIQSHKTRDSNKPIDQKSNTQTPGRQIFTGHKFSSNKNFAVYKKTSPRSDLRWKPTAHNSSDPAPTCQTMASAHNSSDPAPTCQTMASAHNSSDPAPTCLSKASVQISSDPAHECQSMALEHGSLSLGRICQENVSHGDKTGTTSNELDLLFSPMFDELLNGSSKVVSKSQRQQPTTPLNTHTTPIPTCQNPPITTVISSENINQAEPHAENDEVADDEFINIFSTPVQDQGDTSSRHVDSSNMHTFYQRYLSEQHWTKDHPLEQVIGNPSQSVRTRRQLQSDAEICMFALTV
nr:hypothetical protein [Tanacetum cinerariifolium]